MRNNLLALALLLVLVFAGRAQQEIVGNAFDTATNGNTVNTLRTSLTNLNVLNASTYTSTGAVTAAIVSATTLSGNGLGVTGVSTTNLYGTIIPSQAPSLAQAYEDTRLITHNNVNFTNFMLGGSLIMASTTNCVHVISAGEANLLTGNFVTNTIAASLTNTVTHYSIGRISSLFYFISTNGTLLYSSANLFTTNWTQINGAYPVPSTVPGVILDPTTIAFLGSTLGAQLFGFTPLSPDQSTNAARDTIAASNSVERAFNAATYATPGTDNQYASNAVAYGAVTALPGYIVLQTGATNTWVFTNLDRAIAQFAQPADKFTPSGGKISIGPGLFSFTNRFLYTNNNIGGLEIAGAGMNATVLLYAGSTVGNIFTVAGNPTNDNNIDFNCHDFSVYSITNMQAAFFALASCNYWFDKVSMGSWRALIENGLDNSATGHGRGALGIQKELLNPAAEKPGLLGINDFGSQGNQHGITRCYFVNCADGIFFTSDHGLIEQNVFQACGAWLSNSVVIKETSWATTSKNSLGADVILDTSGIVPSLGDVHCLFNVHYRARTGYASFMTSKYPAAQFEYFEGCDYSGLAGGSANLTFFNTSESGSSTPQVGAISTSPYVVSAGNSRIIVAGFDPTSIDNGRVLFVGSSFSVDRSGAVTADAVTANSYQSGPMANGGARYVAVDDDGIFSATTDGSHWLNLPAAQLTGVLPVLNAASLTNIHEIKGLSASANLSFTPTPNADGSSNVAVAITSVPGALITGNIPIAALTNTIFVSTNINFTAGVTHYTINHGLGRAPNLVQAYLVCVSNDANTGMVTGQRLKVESVFNSDTTSPEFGELPDANTTTISITLSESWETGNLAFMQVIATTGGNVIAPSAAANFKLQIVAW